MPGTLHRPYGRSSISELEAVFRKAKADPEILRMVDHELGYRATKRAAKLRSMVVEARAGRLNSGLVVPPTAGREGPRTAGLAGMISLPNATEHPASQPALNPKTFAGSAEFPAIHDFDAPLVSPAAEGRNEPGAIVATWTALEALSPQTYRRPEDLAGGDRRCVVSLSNGQLPWEIGERSRPNYQLYYQVPLGSIAMDAAAEELVKAFGEDEERNRRTEKRALIGSVLIDRDGIPVQENAIAVSSFAWALPLALKLRLATLGDWPSVEPGVIGKLDAVLRRADPDR
jgi:hypothetical protein